MAILMFGSIGTLLDASELQREAFNRAFREHDLDWSWRRDDYRERLARAGGANRIAEYAAERGEALDPKAVHRTKTRIFGELLREGGHAPRDGVAATVRAVRDAGHRLAMVSTTSVANIDNVLAAIAGEVPRDAFEVVLDGTQVEKGKPDPECYETALKRLGGTADEAVAVEDNVDGVTAALAAGIKTVAFPNANTAAHEFPGADFVVTGPLEADAVLAMLDGRAA